MPLTHPCLSIDTEHQSDAYVIRLVGELDLGGCPDLELALAEAEQSQPRRIVLDLEELTFIDARGLRSLVNATRRSACNGNCLQITRGRGVVADMFRLTALDRRLPLTEPAQCPAIRGAGLAPGTESTE